MEDKDRFNLYSQYHGCWWPGDLHRQVISNHDIDLVILEYAGVETRNKFLAQNWNQVFGLFFSKFITAENPCWKHCLIKCHK